MVGKVSGKTARIINMVIIYALLILFGLLCLFPFYMLFVNATRSTLQIQSSISFLPSRYFFENYNSLAENGLNVFRAFLNSFVIAVASTFLSVYVSALTAFAFHVYRFKGSNLLYAILLATIMIPGQLGLIGFYQLMLELQWLDSYLPLILPSMASATTVFFMRQYFSSTLSVDIIEAARIDGSPEFLTFNLIVLPISVPALATVAIGAFVGSWNNYLMPFLLLVDETKYTMPMIVQMLKTNIYATNLGAIYAGLFITVLPLIVVYLFCSKFIIGGVNLGGVKE